MDELIKLITAQLGIDDSTATSAIGKVMALMKGNVGSELFGQIAGAIPGADEAATQAADASEPAQGGGMLGKLVGMASGMLGGKTGGGLEMASALVSTGIDVEKVGPFLSMIFEFLKAKLGDDVVDQIVSKLPMLKSLMG